MTAKATPSLFLRRTIALSALLSTTILVACGGGAIEPLGEAITDCGTDHPLVGATATLETHFHQVAGVATIVDNCTVEITGFIFDGQGLDVRAVLSDDAGFGSYDVISEDLRDDGPYEGEILTLPLRAGMTLDGVSHLSIWCVPAGASFGDGAFELP
jgi:hypothetical protein